MKRIHRSKKAIKESSGQENPQGQLEQGLPIYKIFGTDLTEMASLGKIEKVIGRDKELEQVIWILSRKMKNNPVLIGEPGVGKTAAVEKLALIIAQGNCPDFIEGKKVISIDLNSVVMSGLLNELISEVKSEGLILFMDEIHTLQRPAVFDALKPALARGDISLIGATTLNEFRESIEKDGAMERRFQKVFIDEPSYSECLEILNGTKEKYEEFHNVSYTPESIESFIKLSQRYITDRFLPDKAIDLMDEAGAKIRMARTKSPEVKEKEMELLELTKQMSEQTKAQQFEAAFETHERIKDVQTELSSLNTRGETIPITKEMVEEVVAKKTRIPIEKVTQSQKSGLKGLGERLKVQVIGQDDAVSAVTRVVRRTKAGLKDPNRPEGVFLFVGPTGVGKTEMVKALANEIFGSRDKMFRLDMGEFSESHTVSKLIGSPPGYVGYGEGTQFTEKIRRNPHCIILLDELEKANIKVLQAWLQVFEDGHMTDGQGRKVDFKNTIIIMTSNIGAAAASVAPPKIGFGGSSEKSVNDNKADIIREELKKSLPPEFLNRIDEVILFKPLEKDSLYSIIDNELRKVENKLKERDVKLTWTESVKDLIIKHGYDPQMGARPLRRAIQKYVEDPIASAIIEDDIEGDISLDYDQKAEKLLINGVPVNESKFYRSRRNSFISEEKTTKLKRLMTFESFVMSQPATKPKPSPSPSTRPEPPTKPVPPTRPDDDRIERPSIDTRPLAKKKVSEMDVVKRFQKEMRAKKGI